MGGSGRRMHFYPRSDAVSPPASLIITASLHARERNTESGPANSPHDGKNPSSRTRGSCSTTSQPSQPRLDTTDALLTYTSVIVVYPPLLPTNMDFIELAMSERPRSLASVSTAALPSSNPARSKPIDTQGDLQAHVRPSSSNSGSWSNWWPFNAFPFWLHRASPSSLNDKRYRPRPHFRFLHLAGVLSPVDDKLGMGGTS
ncbi:hypothetical protein BDQ17DRAFT_1363016 [Cyathus striatus]|nr:hypothetical protein BDQ17DRAFT_1363016 [Cyathus striatus]